MLTMVKAQELYQAVIGYDRAKAGARAKWKMDHPQLADALALARENEWI